MRARDRGDSDELVRGRRILEDLGRDTRDSDALASLAGTWKGIDDARALELYRAALVIDAGDPYALGNVLEYELANGDARIEARRMEIASAAERCRSQIEQSENLPWAAFDLAKFSLLLGEPQHAIGAATLAVARSSAAFMVETSLSSIDRIRSAQSQLKGLDEVRKMYLLARIRFEATPFERRMDRFLRPPVLVLAGSSTAESDASILEFFDTIAHVARDKVASLVSGGTRQGVSALAGDLSERLGVPAVGYIPSVVPIDVEVEKAQSRYAEVRETSGDDFSVLEPLAYWHDLAAAGLRAGDVRVLALGGGLVSAAEFRVALALNAQVGVVTGTGGAASDLLRDPVWTWAKHLRELQPSVEEIGSFLS
jgi:hypothetical protein